MDTTVLVAVVGVGGVVAGAVVSGLVSAWIAHRQGKAQDQTANAAAVAAEAAVQDTINAGFAALTAQYERRNTDLLQQNAALEGKLDEALHKLDQQQGEIRDLTQHVESLEATLRRLGYDIPQRKRPHPMAKPPLVALPNPEGSADG